jgi:NAD+ synthase
MALDLEATAERLSAALRTAVKEKLKRRGLVVAISGGIDSACVAALSVRALGPRRVVGLLLPERDSDPESTQLGLELARTLDIQHVVHDITPVLTAAGCYLTRDEAVRSVYPEFSTDDRWKIVLHGDRLNSSALNVFYLVVQPRSGGGELRIRLTPEAYLQIVAGTNFKQRCRKMLEYYHADRLVYAVAGTPNRLEYDQGFFVKLGDGAADVKPIASLYKTQVYALARHLGVIDAILRREPTTDTYSLSQSQEDFYFSVHYSHLDLILYARNHGMPAAEVAAQLGFTTEQIERVYRDIEQKRRSTAYLHAGPLLLEPVAELTRYAVDTPRVEHPSESAG